MNTYNVHGCTCGICIVERSAAERRMAGEIWSAFLADANRERARMAARMAPHDPSLTLRARQYGIVPCHIDDRGACLKAQTISRNAMSLIRFEARISAKYGSRWTAWTTAWKAAAA